MLLETLDAFSLILVAERAVVPTNSIAVLPTVAVPRIAPDTPTTRKDHLLFCSLYFNTLT
jgi:hypothetical protein